MKSQAKVGPNDTCPCWSGRKYKRCCRGTVDWEDIIRQKENQIPYMSVRGRNVLFASAIMDALELDPCSNTVSLEEYKKAFTAEAVRKIYEAVMDIWPPATDIESLLTRIRADVSGIYIGDYHPQYVSRALVRHSIYANKILLVDPFQHPYVSSEKFNPIINPNQHRAQTLKNVNFYFSIMPWIEAGIVEFIRTPADFSRTLNYDAFKRAELAKNDPNVAAAIQESVQDLHARHFKRNGMHLTLLSAPDAYLRKVFKKVTPSGDLSEDDFIDYINTMRANNPDFLEPLGSHSGGQSHMEFAGGTYEMASLSARMSGSYLFTDLKAR